MQCADVMNELRQKIFVANQRPEMPSLASGLLQRQDPGSRACIESADAGRQQISQPRKMVDSRYVFAERHEPHLVVATRRLPGLIEQQGGIEGVTLLGFEGIGTK